MDIHLDDSRYTDDLVAFLERACCGVEQLGCRRLRACVPDSPLREAERLELTLYLQVWRAVHPDAHVRID